MIVRTYGRRKSGITRTYSDSLDDDASDPFKDSLSQEASQDLYNLPYSSQESSSLWTAFDPEPSDFNPNSSKEKSLPILPRKAHLGDLPNGPVRKSKRPRNGKREMARAAKKNCSWPLIPATSTLMEAQEFGEMMEHVDEVNFALDGLKKGQPVRIRRASLLSLLSICGTAQQRRLLRTQGMAKTIIDAILGLSFDDSPSNLAAAAVFFVLTNDGQDDHLLETPCCIHFLIKLLKPAISTATEDKAQKIGCKLLTLRKAGDILQGTTKMSDSSSAAIISKVQEILVSCKEMKSSYGDGSGIGRPELSPKWISLLTMEKACLSKISFEDTTGTVRKTGGNYKEKLRELGGLDAVFEVAMNCHSVMEGSPSIQTAKDASDLQSLVLLLKCLKIMENATFLSKDNQSHLLGMKGNLDSRGSRLSFAKLIISNIRILSGLYLRRSSSASTDEKLCSPSDRIGHASGLALIADDKVESNNVIYISSSMNGSGTEWNSSDQSFNISQNGPWSSTAQLGTSASISESATTSMNGTCLLKKRVNSSMSSSCSERLRSSKSGTPVTSNESRTSFRLGEEAYGRKDAKREQLEDSQDPYAFDEDAFEPSKWDLLSGKQKLSRTQKSVVTRRELEDGFRYQLMMSQQESSDGENCQQQTSNGEHCQQQTSNGEHCQQQTSNGEHHHSHEISCSRVAGEENSSLLADCLLTAVKVLMNLTNDNPPGCQQIAACGGLETMSSLIASHYPSFSSSLYFFSEINEKSSSSELEHQNDRHLTDQELDFLVAILGLLVNLVEKDGHNRSRLAAASVTLPNSDGLEKQNRRDVIPLLCSIFLANRGAGDAAGEGVVNDEAAVLQGEKEAEKMIVEAYAALVLAFLSTESKSIRDAIADCLPNHNLGILVPVLERFVAFHLTLNMISPETHKAVSEVIESCRIP